MFDIGFAEMVIIGIVALLVIGPERLPSVARKAGTYFARVKRFVNNVRSDVEREFRTDELQKMLQQQKDELQSLKDTVNETVRETKKDIDLGSIEQSIRDSGEQIMADSESTPIETTSKDQANPPTQKQEN